MVVIEEPTTAEEIQATQFDESKHEFRGAVLDCENCDLRLVTNNTWHANHLASVHEKVTPDHVVDFGVYVQYRHTKLEESTTDENDNHE